MPFKSENQRKFMPANHPEIAQRWEKEYKKADYKKKTEMLGGKVYAKGGRVGFAHGSKRPKGGWTD